MSKTEKGPLPPKKLSLIMTVVDRGDGLEASEIYRDNGLGFNIIAPARGGAGTDVLDILGVTSAEAEKDLVISTVARDRARQVLDVINSKFHFDKPGTGIAFTIPIVGVSGPRVLRYITGHYEETRLKEEYSKMGEEGIRQEMEENLTEPTYANRQFDLIVTIVNRGHADQVVDAAREVGSHGGTILYARGTGIHEVEKFFGISIQPEKEVVLSMVRRSITKTVVHEIVEHAGLSTEGRGLCFVLPVEDVAGIQHPIDFASVKARGGLSLDEIATAKKASLSDKSKEKSPEENSNKDSGADSDTE